jgi:anti-anti-sigma factor
VSSSLRVETRQLPEVTVVELHGDVSADGETEIKSAYDEAVASGMTTVLIEMAGASYINTSGISVLIAVAMEAKKAGVDLLVCGASPHYKKVFDLVRFSSFVSMFDTEADALASLS